MREQIVTGLDELESLKLNWEQRGPVQLPSRTGNCCASGTCDALIQVRDSKKKKLFPKIITLFDLCDAGKLERTYGALRS